VVLALLAACDREQHFPPSVRYTDHVAAGGNQPPAGEIKNPLPIDSANASDGSKVFSAMNCDGCHGGGATGWVGPSLADGRWRYGGADDEIFQSIFYGRPRGMPAFGGVLPADAVWMLVAYLQSLPAPATVPTQSWEKR